MPNDRMNAHPYTNSGVKDVSFDTQKDKKISVCTLVLDNDRIVTGEYTCEDDAGFDRELAEKFAYDAAYRRIHAEDA